MDKESGFDKVKNAISLAYPKNEFRKDVNMLFDFAESCLQESGSMAHMIQVTWMNYESELERALVSIMEVPESHDHRMQIYREVGAKFAETPGLVLSAITVSEAWCRQFKDIEEMDKNLSEYEDKKEIILISGVSIEKVTMGKIADIDRTDANNVKLNNVQWLDEGLESNLLQSFFLGYVTAKCAEKGAKK